MKRFRVMAAALCAAVLLCGFSTTAYAGGGEDYMEGTGGYDPAEPVTEPEPEPTTEEILLELAADHEARLCEIELGV